MLDPGFGFGKTLHHNLDLSANLDHIADMGLPVMAGLSRQGMIGAISGRDVEHRQVASAAAALIASHNGARCCGCMTWPKRLMRWPCCGPCALLPYANATAEISQTRCAHAGLQHGVQGSGLRQRLLVLRLGLGQRRNRPAHTEFGAAPRRDDGANRDG